MTSIHYHKDHVNRLFNHALTASKSTRSSKKCLTLAHSNVHRRNTSRATSFIKYKALKTAVLHVSHEGKHVLTIRAQRKK